MMRLGGGRRQRDRTADITELAENDSPLKTFVVGTFWTRRHDAAAAYHGSGVPVENSPANERCPLASLCRDDGLASAKLIMNSMTTPANATIGSSHIKKNES
jgi:hypothetical protein